MLKDLILINLSEVYVAASPAPSLSAKSGASRLLASGGIPCHPERSQSCQGNHIFLAMRLDSVPIPQRNHMATKGQTPIIRTTRARHGWTSGAIKSLNSTMPLSLRINGPLRLIDDAQIKYSRFSQIFTARVFLLKEL